MLSSYFLTHLHLVRAIMWSQHGFWNNLEAGQPGYPPATGHHGAGHGAAAYYPGYDQDLTSYYKHYGYDSSAFSQKIDGESPGRGKNKKQTHSLSRM